MDQPSSGGSPGYREQGKQGARPQGKGATQAHPQPMTVPRPIGNDSSKNSHSDQLLTNGVLKAMSKPPSSQGGIATIFSNDGPPGDWVAVSKHKPVNPQSHPAAPPVTPSQQPTSSAAAAGVQVKPFIPVVSSIFDRARSTNLESAQLKLEDLCQKRSELDQEMKMLVESMAEDARQQKAMRDKLTSLEKDLEGERVKRESLEVEVKALTKQRQDEMTNRERLQEEAAAESQRRLDAAQALHDQSLSELRSKCESLEQMYNQALGELDQFRSDQQMQNNLQYQMAAMQQQHQLGSQGGFLQQGGMPLNPNPSYLPPPAPYYQGHMQHQGPGGPLGGPFLHPQDPGQGQGQGFPPFTNQGPPPPLGGFFSQDMGVAPHPHPHPQGLGYMSHVTQYGAPPPQMMQQQEHSGGTLNLYPPGGGGYGGNTINPNDFIMAGAGGGGGPFGNPHLPRNGSDGVGRLAADRFVAVTSLHTSSMGPSSSDQVVNPHLSPVSSTIKGSEGRAPGSPLPLIGQPGEVPSSQVPSSQAQAQVQSATVQGKVTGGKGGSTGGGFGAGFGEDSEDSSALLAPPFQGHKGGSKGKQQHPQQGQGFQDNRAKGQGQGQPQPQGQGQGQGQGQRRMSSDRAPQPNSAPQPSSSNVQVSGGGGGGRGGGQVEGLPPKAEGGGRGRGKGKGPLTAGQP